MYSPRPTQQQQILALQFAQEREKLRQEIGQQLRQNMASIIGHQPTADLLLISADGRKMPAHLCILKRRAPSFFQRYILPILEAITSRNANHQYRELLEICVGDVDSATLEFFIRSIYTDEEVSGLNLVQTHSVPQNDHPDENDPGRGGYGPNGNNNPQNWHTLPSLTTTNSSSTFKDRGRQNEQNAGIVPEMVSASFSSPSSSENPAGLISFRELAATSKSSSQQQLAMNLPAKNEDLPKVIGNAQIGQNFGEIDGGEQRLKQQFASIFPYYVEIGTNRQQFSMMTRSLPSAPAEEISQHRPTGSQSSLGGELEQMATSIRNRAIAARRLSASSANSLTSIDLPTPGQEFQPFGFPTGDQIVSMPMASIKLGEDLLQILERDANLADARLIAGDSEELAHTAILWASGSEFFRQQISSLKFAPSPERRCKIEMRRFEASSLHFFLQFIYGGVCSLPSQQNDQNALDLWELVELGAFTKINLFIQLIVLHMRATFCHFFHRPCASCVSAVFEALPKMELEIPEMKKLFDEAMLWQAANFTRIWKGRVFLHLADHWQKRCRDALLQSVDEESVIDVLLGCEKLQLTFPRIKLQEMAQKVLKAVNDVEEYCLEFLANSLDSLIQSNSFSSYGRGLALNLTLLEDILPPIIHSLSAETTIRSFLALKELLTQLEEKSATMRKREQLLSGTSSCTNSPLKKPQHQAFGGSNRSLLFGSNQSIISAGWREQFLMDEWNPRFKCLCRRLLDLLDQHMIHHANSIVNSTEWNQLNADEQNRIHENGLFVEMRMPRMAPPRLSSTGRSYKRSSSVGFSQLSHPSSCSNSHERTRSLERNNSIRFGQIAGSRPSLSTQMEEEYCESTNSQNEKESEDEKQEIQPKLTIKGENGAQKTEKLGTKIPAKIAQQKMRNKNAMVDLKEKGAELKKESKMKEGQNVKGVAHSQIGERKLKMKQKIERKSREVGENGNSEQISINQMDQKRMNVEQTTEVCKELKEKEQFLEEPEKCILPTPPIYTASTNVNAVDSASEEVGDTPIITTMNERQLTHTVMTVDQNIRAGINAYLERIGGPTSSTIGPIGSSAIQKNGTKPQSIVRPMPKMTAATESTNSAAVEMQRESRRKTNSRNTRIVGHSLGQRGGMIQQQQTKISGIRRPLTTAIKK